MGLFFHAENEGIAGQADFDGNVTRLHLFQQIFRIAFVGDVNTMPDALGAGDFDGVSDVATQAHRRHHAQREFSGMQGQAHVGEALFEEAEHGHVQAVVAHGDDAVFRADDVDADDQGIVVRGGKGGV